MINLLILLHLLDRDEARAQNARDAEMFGRGVGWLLLPVLVTVALPVLVWVAVRQTGGSRPDAAIGSIASLTIVTVLAALAGIGWGIVAAFVLAVGAIIYVAAHGIRERRRREAEEKFTTGWRS